MKQLLHYVLCILKALDLYSFQQYCIVLNRVKESSRRGDVTAKAAAEWWKGAVSHRHVKYDSIENESSWRIIRDLK